MLVNEDYFGKVAVSCLSFSYTDEYDESFTDSVKDEEDFENVDDGILNQFDDDIYGDDLDDEDQSNTTSVVRTDDFGDDIYEDITETDDIE